MIDIVSTGQNNLQQGSEGKLSLVNLETLWLANKTRENTMKTYKVAFHEFCELNRIQDSDHFRKAGMAEIIYYRQYLSTERGLKPRTIRNRLSALSDCFGFLKSNGAIAVNPVDDVERPKVDESRGVTPVMTDNQVLQLLDQPDQETLAGARDYAILCFYLYMGSRVSSASTMAVEDYYEDNGFYVLNFEKKGGQRQIEAVNPQLQHAINQYLGMSEHSGDKKSPLFISVRKDKYYGKALSRQQFTNIWAKYRDRAYLDAKFTPHSARATLATLLDRMGEPLQKIQHLLGHANPSTTQTYTHNIVEYQDSPVFKVSYGSKSINNKVQES